MEAAWKVRSLSKVASTSPFGRTHSIDTFPLLASRVTCAAAGEGKEGLSQAAHPTDFPTDNADALFRPMRVPFECPLVEHPGVTAYSGDRRAQLVAGIGGEASLTLQCLLPANEGGLQAREQSVYRNNQTPELVFGVGHGQPFGEVALAHLAGGAGYGVHRPQGCSRQL